MIKPKRGKLLNIFDPRTNSNHGSLAFQHSCFCPPDLQDGDSRGAFGSMCRSKTFRSKFQLKNKLSIFRHIKNPNFKNILKRKLNIKVLCETRREGIKHQMAAAVVPNLNWGRGRGGGLHEVHGEGPQRGEDRVTPLAGDPNSRSDIGPATNTSGPCGSIFQNPPEVRNRLCFRLYKLL